MVPSAIHDDVGAHDDDSTGHCILPVNNPLTSFWLKEPHELGDYRSTPDLPERSDVVIIGGGYAGVATAYHLLKQSPGEHFSITLLEARGVCTGATGRNGGHLRPDMYGHIGKHMARAGREAGAEVAQFEVENMWAIKRAIEDEEIECDFTLTRSVDVWCNEEGAQKAKAAYDFLVSQDLEYMKDVFFITDPSQAEGYSGIKGAKAAASFTAGTMWPYKFILGLLRKILQTGRLNLQTNTPVTAIRSDEDHPELVVIETKRGAIVTPKVVHASNAYVSGVLPEYRHSIIPCKGTCCHIDIPKDSHSSSPRSPPPFLTNSYIIRDENQIVSYLIPRTDGGIIVGGAQTTFRPFRSQWYGNLDDGVQIDAAKGYYDHYMQRTFRGWEDSAAAVSQTWTGVMGYSFDTSPHVGLVPSRPGQFIIAGFNGHGMPVIWLSAKGLAEMILADRKGQKVAFKETGIPRLFETSQLRIDRSRKYSEEEGDILGSGAIFLPREPLKDHGHEVKCAASGRGGDIAIPYLGKND